MIPTVLGGIGLFLLGMLLLTDGLKSLAGDALRRLLARFAGGPVSSMLSGAALTALVQSSSATTLATIGFVSAGLLTFSQAVGVVFGSNLGTTSTGWIVSTVGLKVNVAQLALPLVGVGALLRLLTRDRWAATGLTLAGFGLLFVGLDTLQVGMKGLSAHFQPADLASDSVWGRLGLVGLGVAMTVVMQSSSAAVATTLTALHAGTLSLSQAAALVIGQNIGTTVTAALGAIGASVPARRTALAHILFNVITGGVALLILPLFLALVQSVTTQLGGEDAATVLAGFHTAFNLLGVAIFLPMTARYAAFISRLVPDQGPVLTRHLDRTVANVPAVALEVSRRTLGEIARVVMELAVVKVSSADQRASLRPRQEAAHSALQHTLEFLTRIQAGDSSGRLFKRQLELVQVTESLRRLLDASAESAPARTLHQQLLLRPLRQSLTEALGELQRWWGGGEASLAQVETRLAEVKSCRDQVRTTLLERASAGGLSAEETSHLLDAVRWTRELVALVEPLARGLGPEPVASPLPEPGVMKAVP